MTGGSDAPGLVLAPTAVIGRDVRLGAHVVIHEGTIVRDGAVIGDGAILGKPSRPSAYHPDETPPAPLVVGEGAYVGANAVLCAGVRLEAGAMVGDASFLRGPTVIGRGSRVGSHCVVDPDVVVGERVAVQTRVYLTAGTVIEDDVFVGPCAVTTNDDTMARHAPRAPLRGPILRRACRIGGGAVLVPGVEIGEEAFVAAGAVVTNDVAARAVVMGVPARMVRKVGDADLLEHWR